MELSDYNAGLYRHFKGAVYFSDCVLKNQDNEWMVHYCNALNPHVWYVHPLAEWDTDVTDRIGKDNITGQTHRFERISAFCPTARDVSTEQLVRELAEREDSPIHGLDLECLMSAVTAVDYCVGTFQSATRDCGAGVYTHASFDSVEEAERSAAYQNTLGANIYKRTFIKVV